MLAITTDMKAPKDVNAVGLTVSTNNVVKYSAIGRVTPDGEVLLPATLAVVEPDEPSATIRIRVVAFQETKTRVLRDVRTSIPSGGKISLLRLPLNFVNDKSGAGDIPSAALPPKRTGGGATLGSGDSDPSTAMALLQTSCKDAEQTVINGECQDSFVDFNALPEFKPELVGAGDKKESCFDVKACFASAVSLGAATSAAPPTSTAKCRTDADCAGQKCVDGTCTTGGTATPADAGSGQGGFEDAGVPPRGLLPLDVQPQTVTLDKAACSIQYSGEDPAKLNLALVTADTGECIRPGECYVPLDSGDGGWKADGGQIKLPAFVCRLLGDQSKGIRLAVALGCASKKEANPVCAETVPSGSGDDGDGGKIDAGPELPPTSPNGGLFYAVDNPTSAIRIDPQSIAVADLAGGLATVAMSNGSSSGTGWGGAGQSWWLDPLGAGVSGYVLTNGSRRVRVAATASVAMTPAEIDIAEAANAGTLVNGTYVFATASGLYIAPSATTPALLPGTSGRAFTAVYPYGNLLAAGDAQGGVSVCDSKQATCGPITMIPGRVEGFLSRPGVAGVTSFFILTSTKLLTTEVTPSLTLTNVAPVGGVPPSTPVTAPAYLRRGIDGDLNCVYFATEKQLWWARRTAGPVTTGPVPLAVNAPGEILGVAVGNAPATAGGGAAIFYTVFGPHNAGSGGGVYWTRPPKECGGSTTTPIEPDAGPPDGGFDAGPTDAGLCKTCAQMPGVCGPQPNGCGGTINCGCLGGQVCNGGTCVPSGPADATVACTPQACGTQNATCGPVGDGCGGTIPNCGPCTFPQTCGGGGVPSQCGMLPDGGSSCVKRTCAQVGAECGPVADGCGGLMTCGACSSGVCGGGGSYKCTTPCPKALVGAPCASPVDCCSNKCSSMDGGAQMFCQP